MSMAEDFTRAIKIAAAIEQAEKAARKQALLDAAGDVCAFCGNQDPNVEPSVHIAFRRWAHTHKYERERQPYCTAAAIHQRIKEEEL